MAANHLFPSCSHLSVLVYLVHVYDDIQVACFHQILEEGQKCRLGPSIHYLHKSHIWFHVFLQIEILNILIYFIYSQFPEQSSSEFHHLLILQTFFCAPSVMLLHHTLHQQQNFGHVPHHFDGCIRGTKRYRTR